MGAGEFSALAGALGTLLIVLAGSALVFRAKRLAAQLLVGGIIIAYVDAAGILETTDWMRWAERLGLPAFAEKHSQVLIVAGGFVVILLVLNLLRHFLALFIGRDTANSSVGNIVSVLITGVFSLLFVAPLRRLRRLLEYWGRP